MKKVAFILGFYSLMLIPGIASAQFEGGSGRGDVFVETPAEVNFEGNDVSIIFKGGVGKGDVMIPIPSQSLVSYPVITVQPVSPSAICQGGATTSLSVSATSSSPSILYQWQYSSDNSSWNNVQNGIPSGAIYTNSNSSSGFVVSGISDAGTYYYRALVLGSTYPCCPVASNSVTLVVVSDPSITSQPTDAGPVCSGGSASFSYTASGGTPTLSHQWQYSTTGTGSWSNVSSGSPAGASYSGQTSTSLSINGLSSTGTHYYRSVVGASGSDCGTLTTNVVSVVVNELLSIQTQTMAPPSICPGGTSNPMSLGISGGGPSVSIQWQYSANNLSWSNVSNNVPSGASYTNSTSASGFTVSGITNSGSYHYRGVATSNTAGCGSVTGASVSLTVAQSPAILSILSTSDTICPGSTESLTINASGGTPSLQYQWQIFSNGQWTNVSNQTPTGFTYTNASTSVIAINTVPTAENGYWPYRCKIYASGSGCTELISDSLSLSSIPSVWLGKSTDASDPANWLHGCIPSTGSNVEVDSSAEYDLPLGQNSVYGDLIFHGSGKGIVMNQYDLSIQGNFIGADSANFIKTNGSGKLCSSIASGDSLFFPVGCSAYNPVQISNNTGVTDHYCVRVLDEVFASGTSGNIMASDPRVRRTWDIGSTIGNAQLGDGVDFKFWWNMHEDTLNPISFFLSHYEEGKWNQLPGTSLVTNKTLSYYGYKGGFSPFAINGNFPLPVSWQSIFGTCVSGNILLKWATAAEINNRRFVTEGSKDGLNWKALQELEGQGNSNSLNQYSSLVSSEFSYLRIRQEDFDGNTDYSETIHVDCSEKKPQVIVMPNPSNGIFVLRNLEKTSGLMLYNALGKKVLQHTINGQSQYILDLGAMDKGIYTLRLIGQDPDQLLKLILQ